MWSALFSTGTAIAAFGWLLLVSFPRRPLTHSAILYLGTGLLCLVYAVCLGLVMAGHSGGLKSANLASIAGLRGLFQSDGGVVIGWLHYLAFDLFIGLWIARDADAKGFGRLAQLPFLILTCLAGPVGLLGWMILRERRARALGRG